MNKSINNGLMKFYLILIIVSVILHLIFYNEYSYITLMTISVLTLMLTIMFELILGNYGDL